MGLVAEITEYGDFFSNWYGLQDGTLLSVSDARGKEWIKVNGETMTVEEFNANR